MYGANQTCSQKAKASQSRQTNRIRPHLGHCTNRRKSQNKPQAKAQLEKTKDKGIGEPKT